MKAPPDLYAVRPIGVLEVAIHLGNCFYLRMRKLTSESVREIVQRESPFQRFSDQEHIIVINTWMERLIDAESKMDRSAVRCVEKVLRMVGRTRPGNLALYCSGEDHPPFFYDRQLEKFASY